MRNGVVRHKDYPRRVELLGGGMGVISNKWYGWGAESADGNCDLSLVVLPTKSDKWQL